MLNKFTYELELNNLNQCTTKSELKQKITVYNRKSFAITSGTRIQLYLPYYTKKENQEKVHSITLYFNLLQQAIAKYDKLYDIAELPNYAQYVAQLNLNITFKE